MGMFNSILADVQCPETHKAGRDTEIQMKWQVQEAREGTVYRVGDVLGCIDATYDNTWIRTDYVCPICSKRTPAKDGRSFIKTMDQRRHVLFVRIDDAVISQILPEQDFDALGVSDFVSDICY